MTTLPLSSDTLDVIIFVQSAEKYFRSETFVERNGAVIKDQVCVNKRTASSDSIDRTENHYNALGGRYLNSIGLMANKRCFMAIRDFKVTVEIMEAEVDKLGAFTFSY